MKSKLVFLVLLGAICTPAVGSSQTGSDMLRNCQSFLKDPTPAGLMFPSGICAGYVLGIVDGLMYAQIADPDRTGVCMPEKGYTVRQGIRVLTKYLEDHPETLNLAISLTALDAFRKAFPCK